MDAIGTVGKKGELFPPKGIREKIGLKSGCKVLYRVDDSKLTVEPIPDVLTVLWMPKYAKTTIEKFEKTRKELTKKLVER